MAFYKEFSPALLDTVILLYSPAVDRDIAGGLWCYSIVCCQPILCDVRLWRGPPAFNVYKHRLPVKLCEIQNYLKLDFNGQFIQSWFHILLNYSAWRVSSPKLGQKHTFSHLAMQKIHSRRWQQFEMIFRHCRQWGLQDRTQEFHFGTRCCCFVFWGRHKQNSVHLQNICGSILKYRLMDASPMGLKSVKSCRTALLFQALQV